MPYDVEEGDPQRRRAAAVALEGGSRQPSSRDRIGLLWRDGARARASPIKVVDSSSPVEAATAGADDEGSSADSTEALLKPGPSLPVVSSGAAAQWFDQQHEAVEDRVFL